MNIYDFDNTIFKGDSSVKFIKYSLLRHPVIVIISFIKSIKEIIKYLFHKSDIGLIKSELFSFVKYIPNLDKYMDTYTNNKIKYIKKFYLNQQKEDDVIISASFDFIIIPFCNKLKIKNIIATKYDTKLGKIIGINCKGEEKVRRFREEYKNVLVKEAYSDSLSDIPMLKLSKFAFLVKNDIIIPFEGDKNGNKKI